jgi:thymidine phosphorylase
MNEPLGQKIGNALEVSECIELMSGSAQAEDLIEIIVALSAEMLRMAGVAKNVADVREMLQKKLASGDALKKFRDMVRAQGGDPDAPLPVARQKKEIAAPASGFVHAIECDQIGYAVIALGGGRKVVADKIDLAVGFEQPKKIGDRVKKGDPLMLMHFNEAARASEAERMVQNAYTIKAEPVKTRPTLITERIE